jgi:hypothetical protein
MIIGSDYRRPDVNWHAVGGQLLPFRHNEDGSCERRTWEPLPGSQCVFLDCPYGAGHNWVKARWRLPVPPGHIVGSIIKHEADGSNCLPRVAIHGHLDENLVLLHAEPGYKDTIRTAARNPAELEAWLNGSWDIVAGEMIDDIWARLRERIVVEPFQIPPNWKLDRSLDWGSSKPSSVGFWAESDGSDYFDAKGKWHASVKGDLFRIGEIYTWNGRPNEGSRILATELSRQIVQYQIDRGWQTERWNLVRPGPADSSIFDEENGNCITTDLERKVKIDSHEYRGASFELATRGQARASRVGNSFASTFPMSKASLASAANNPACSSGARARIGCAPCQACRATRRTWTTSTPPPRTIVVTRLGIGCGLSGWRMVLGGSPEPIDRTTHSNQRGGLPRGTNQPFTITDERRP